MVAFSTALEPIWSTFRLFFWHLKKIASDSRDKKKQKKRLVVLVSLINNSFDTMDALVLTVLSLNLREGRR